MHRLSQFHHEQFILQLQRGDCDLVKTCLNVITEGNALMAHVGTIKQIIKGRGVILLSGKKILNFKMVPKSENVLGSHACSKVPGPSMKHLIYLHYTG